MRFYPEADQKHQLNLLFNKGLDFNDNLRGGFVEFVTTGGSETIRHNLGFVPIGWIMIYNDALVSLYAEDVESWTTESLFLQSNAASVTVRLFVM